MPQPKKAARFGGTSAHHKVMMANLATELLRHGRITTTHAKAKTVQPLAEKLITFGKKGDLNSRRQALRVVRDKDVVHKLFATIGPAFAERDGGYTRVLKLGPRKGDAAPMALIELVESAATAQDESLSEAPARRWSLRRRSGTRSAAATERELERAAAIDRGEDVDAVHDHVHDHDHDHDHDEPEAAEADTDEVDTDGPQVSPEEVEARLAAADEAESAEADAPEADDDAAASEDADEK